MIDATKALEDKIKELDKEIVKPVYSSRIDKRVKSKSAKVSDLNKLAESIRVIIENSNNAELQHNS